MHAPLTATQVVELLGGPLDGERHDIPAHASALSWDADSPAQYWDGDPKHSPASLAGHAYFYNPFATQRLGRPIFIHATLPWDYLA